MAEELNGTPNPGSQDPQQSFLERLSGKELSMETRLLIAFGLMGIVLFAYQYFMPKPDPAKQPPAAAQKQEEPAKAPQTAQAPAKQDAPAPAKDDKSAPAAEKTAGDKEETHVIETPVYRVVFSNKGAVIRSWTLKNYKNTAGKPVELVNAAAAPKSGWAFSYVFPQAKPATDLNRVLFHVKKSDPLSVEYEFNDGATSATKTFYFDARGYRAVYSSEVLSGGKSLAHHMAWRGGFGDSTVHNAADQQKSVHYDAVKSKLVEEAYGYADKGPMTVAGNFHFAGLEDPYFAGVILPEPGSTIELTTWNDKVAGTPGGEEKAHVGASFGGAGLSKAILFVGPKDTDILRSTDPKLESMIDWGWFWFIAKPLFMALHWTNTVLTNNWGWAIVFLTIIINLLMLPMRFSQLRSSKKMALIQPELKALQDKYKNIPMKDPRKQKQNEEMMALYQKHGINPMGGCLPLLLQMPFFIAFYKVLSVSIELRNAQWLWIGDLSQPENLPIHILPVIMLVSQIWMQKMTPAVGADPSQQRMMMIMMPVMFGVMFYNSPSGLVLYWLTGNLVGIVQQFFFNRAATTPAPAQASLAKKK